MTAWSVCDDGEVIAASLTLRRLGRFTLISWTAGELTIGRPTSSPSSRRSERRWATGASYRICWAAIPDAPGRVVAAHRLAIEYVTGKRSGPRAGHYIVTILGPRINACWKFRPIELEHLARLVTDLCFMPAVGTRRGRRRSLVIDDDRHASRISRSRSAR